jgi:transposase
MCAKRAWLFAERVLVGRCPTVRRECGGVLARLPKGAHLIIEASGGYERELVKVAQQSAVALSVVNPRQVRDFARGVGRLAETDPIDAEMLARFGAEVNPPPDAVPSATEVAL